MSGGPTGEVDGLEEGEFSGLIEYNKMVSVSVFQEEAAFEVLKALRPQRPSYSRISLPKAALSSSKPSTTAISMS